MHFASEVQSFAFFDPPIWDPQKKGYFSRRVSAN